MKVLKVSNEKENTIERGKKYFFFKPTKTTYIAFITEILMILSYFSINNLINSRVNFFIEFFIFGILTNLFLNVIFPIVWMVIYQKESLKALGITKDHLFLSILISILFSFFMAFQVFSELEKNNVGISHLIFNGIILWEPFFVYCWLQLRYEKAFGIVPGIILTGFSFIGYHIGTFPLESLLILLFWGIIFAIIFHFVKNLLVLWPLTWSFSSTLGTLMGGYEFTWNLVLYYSIILIIQIGFIIFIKFYWNKSKGEYE